MTCLLCNSPAAEISLETIPAAEYPIEYEIDTKSCVEVKYTCTNCKITFYVLDGLDKQNCE